MIVTKKYRGTPYLTYRSALWSVDNFWLCRPLWPSHPAGLIEVGGVKDEQWSRDEAEQILADRGGRGWKIKDVQVEHDMGPDTGSARLMAEDKAGKAMRDTFTVTREKGTWHLVVFTQQPAESGKESASADKPSS
ncbi:hypothetical protein [Streptomyces regalis]|uniref:Uncharacterized protein n=1 Tax=Streptomyces regalis TaxID=68262 RepID=A0A124G8B7_9ACTN|nr:hypothetical protein [Streptomyces regalis]KUL25462.1 hypothetical protein ADL12_34960 [Streptomyces regalis]